MQVRSQLILSFYLIVHFFKTSLLPDNMSDHSTVTSSKLHLISKVGQNLPGPYIKNKNSNAEQNLPELEQVIGDFP